MKEYRVRTEDERKQSAIEYAERVIEYKQFDLNDLNRDPWAYDEEKRHLQAEIAAWNAMLKILTASPAAVVVVS